jgi:subfamily B ATP-binding cassette protein HlyB/CyaB
MFKRQKKQADPSVQVSRQSLLWVLGSYCHLTRLPFDAELLLQQFPPPYSTDSLVHASRLFGLS